MDEKRLAEIEEQLGPEADAVSQYEAAPDIARELAAEVRRLQLDRKVRSVARHVEMRKVQKAVAERLSKGTVPAFLSEVADVCRRHGLSLAHEDGHGAFLVEPLKEVNLRWLADARNNIDAD